MALGVAAETDIRRQLGPALARDATAWPKALSLSVQEATQRVKERARAQVRTAFPGKRRLPTTVRGVFYEAQPGKPPHGRIFSAWFNKRGLDVLYGFTVGLTIRPAKGRLLLVPIDSSPGAVAKARAAIAVLGQAPRIAIIRSKAGKLLLIEKGDNVTTILATLTPSVKLPRRLNFGALEQQAYELLGARLTENLAKAGF